MTTKSEAERAYNPEQKDRKEKVLIGLSGGMDSFVTAYLLKIQKYEVLAATVVVGPDQDELPIAENFSCGITNERLEEIRSFCQRLGIPLQVLRVSGEFKEKVLNSWVSDHISGKISDKCWNCHDLRMETLYGAMKEAGASKLATGHYAKLFTKDHSETVAVHTSNDPKNDQSPLLSRLSKEILSHLILPLSDLTKADVLKLAQNFGAEASSTPVEIHHCLKRSEGVESFLRKEIPARFKGEGELTNLEGTLNLGQHLGLETHYVGEQMSLKENGKAQEGFIASYSPHEKKFIVATKDYFIRRELLLTSCHITSSESFPEPFKGFAILPTGAQVECWVHPKTLDAVYLEFSEPQEIQSGAILSVVKKKGKNGRILLTGEVRYLEVSPPEEADSEEEAPKTIKTLRF